MPEDWADLLEKVDQAVAASRGVVDDDVWRDATAIVREARMRLSYPEEVAVVALVGGTGSGKSTLLNAMVATEVAPTGGMRPTTQSPVAVVPSVLGSSLDEHLEHLGVEEIHHLGIHERLCLLDLPDTDSVEVGHRLQVERLIPIVDAVVWVLDPEKYRDATLHHEHISPLAAHADRFVFVLNQADRLDDETRLSVEEDLRRALAEDGIDHPLIVVTSAAPPAGPPSGIGHLIDQLLDRVGTRATLLAKLVADLRDVVDRLLGATGGSGLRFEERSAAAIEDAMTALREGDETAAVLEVTWFLNSLAAEAGEVVGAQIEALTEQLPVQVRAVAEDAGPPLTESVIAPVRSLLARRARANALLTEAALALRAVLAGTPG